MTERLFTTEEAAAQLDIPAARIRKWKHRGLVVPVSRMRGRGRRGLAPLYRLEDLRVVLERAAQSRGTAHSDVP